MSRGLRGRGRDAAAAAALLALPWLLYGGVLGLWWTEDDFHQVRYAAEHSPAAYALDPEVRGKLPNRLLTPLLFASYDLDLALAGPRPAAFYGHQLAALGLAAVALYALLRLWHPPAPALAAGALFLLGPPVASMAPLLMVRHYPEAMALALVAARVFVHGVRALEEGRERRAWALAGASAGLWLAAGLAKEIALPLPAVLAVLPAGSPRRRLALLAPHAAALALYLGYRAWMLGTPLGGLPWVLGPVEWLREALALPWALARELAGAGTAAEPWGWTAVALLALGAAAVAASGRLAAGLAAAVAFAVLLPLLPVVADVEPRYAAAAWLALVAAAPAAARRPIGPALVGRSAGRRALALAALGALAVAAVVANRAAWGAHLDAAVRKSAENRALLALGPGELLRQPLGAPGTMAAIAPFARSVLGREVAAGWFYDDLYLCRGRGAPREVLSD